MKESAPRLRLPDGTAVGVVRVTPERAVATVLVQTPYGAESQLPMARSWAQRGLDCWVVDVRGRYASEGEWLPYSRVAEDGLDTAALVTDRGAAPALLLHGSSYSAHTALETARALHLAGSPALAGVAVAVPVLGPGETAWDPQGRPLVRERVGWWHEHGVGRASGAALEPARLAERVAAVRTHGIEAARGWGWPEATVGAWLALWEAPRVQPAARWGGMSVPLLSLGGRFDPFRSEAAALAQGWGGPAEHAEGPWGHHLLASVTEPAQRARVNDAGGPGAVLDGWIRRHVPGATTHRTCHPAPPPGWRRVFSELRPSANYWRHSATLERTLP